MHYYKQQKACNYKFIRGGGDETEAKLVCKALTGASRVGAASKQGFND